MMYKDKRGWRYRVMSGIGMPPVFKGRYNKPNSDAWKCVRALPWRETKEEADKDLAEYAARHNMQIIEERSA